MVQSEFISEEEKAKYEFQIEQIRAITKEIKHSNQEQRVLDYLLEYGSITPLDAIREFSITRLSDRIFTLRNKGYCIITEMKSAKNKFGEDVRYAEYRLEN